MALYSTKSLVTPPLRCVSRPYRSALPIPFRLQQREFVRYEGVHAQILTHNPIDDRVVNNGVMVYAMRHRRRVKKLGRPADQRKALLRGLTTELLRHGKITTTTARAKALRPYIDKMIGLAKRGDLHARRQALAWIYDKQLVKKVFEKVPDRYPDRNSGFTRVKKQIKRRRGDNAELSSIELV